MSPQADTLTRTTKEQVPRSTTERDSTQPNASNPEIAARVAAARPVSTPEGAAGLAEAARGYAVASGDALNAADVEPTVTVEVDVVPVAEVSPAEAAKLATTLGEGLVTLRQYETARSELGQK